MKMNIKKFADLTGVSVRTLHYYDEIGLLKPDFVDEQTAYRFYGQESLNRMQEILFYRELDFSLNNIKEILSSKNYNKKEALKGQKQLLMLKKQRIERIIQSIENAESGEENMNFTAFDNTEFETQRKAYKDEVEKRWGNTNAYKENQQKTKDYSKDDWSDVKIGLDKILNEFAQLKNNGVTPTNELAIKQVQKLQEFITKTQYTCTKEILLGLADMYVADDRFKSYIDQNGTGTAKFISIAIKSYCGK